MVPTSPRTLWQAGGGPVTAGSPLWYLTRSSAIIAFVLLTGSVVMGVAATRRTPAWWPRFASQALHRNMTLLALGFLVLHITTTVLDSYVSVSWFAAVVPFASGYRTLWVTAGTIAGDLMIVLIVSSLARVRFGYARWRALHWLAYVAWPMALVHFLGTGTDARSGWGLMLALGCLIAVLGAVGVRFGTVEDEEPGPARAIPAARAAGGVDRRAQRTGAGR